MCNEKKKCKFGYFDTFMVVVILSGLIGTHLYKQSLIIISTILLVHSLATVMYVYLKNIWWLYWAAVATLIFASIPYFEYAFILHSSTTSNLVRIINITIIIPSLFFASTFIKACEASRDFFRDKE